MRRCQQLQFPEVETDAQTYHYIRQIKDIASDGEAESARDRLPGGLQKDGMRVHGLTGALERM